MIIYLVSPNNVKILLELINVCQMALIVYNNKHAHSIQYMNHAWVVVLMVIVHLDL